MHAQKTSFNALLSFFYLNPRKKKYIFAKDIYWNEMQLTKR
jgi:hypothetical protein